MLAGVHAFLAQLPDLPDPKFRTDPGPYLILFGAGFLTAVLGHVVQVKTMVAVGVLMIFLATVALPIVARLNY